MDHEAERAAKDSPAWKVHELIVVNFVVRSLGLEQFSHKDIRKGFYQQTLKYRVFCQVTYSFNSYRKI
jgi:hypothetical protein